MHTIASFSSEYCSIEIATRAADHFTRLYYTAYDSSTRMDDLPKFYRANSALTWNGKPFEGTDGVRELLIGIPATKHEVQSFDCHPIPGGCRHNPSRLRIHAKQAVSLPIFWLPSPDL